MIEPDVEMSIRRQCEVLRVSRPGLYYEPKSTDPEELELMRRMDEPSVPTSARQLGFPNWVSRAIEGSTLATAMEVRDTEVVAKARRRRFSAEYTGLSRRRALEQVHALRTHATAGVRGGRGSRKVPSRGGTLMVTIGMNYSVLEGKERIFEDACARVIRTMKGIDGHSDSHLFREVGEGKRNYLIVSEWASEDAFRTFIASDAFSKVTNWGAQNILAAKPSHTVYG